MMANTVTSSSPMLGATKHAPRLDQCFAGELCTRAIAATQLLCCYLTGKCRKASIIPSIMLRRGQTGNGRYGLVVGLDALAKEKKGSVPAESSTRVWDESLRLIT
jgi:hypothetical protein